MVNSCKLVYMIYDFQCLFKQDEKLPFSEIFVATIQTALLLDLVRNDLYKEGFQRTATGKDKEKQENKAAPLWVARSLEMVELVFRPPNGGPPSFPEHGDAVSLTFSVILFCCGLFA